MQRFTMSPEELRRRSKAFTTLLVSTFLGLLVSTGLLLGTDPLLVGIGFGTIAIIFCISRMLFERSLKTLSRIELGLSRAFPARSQESRCKSYCFKSNLNTCDDARHP